MKIRYIQKIFKMVFLFFGLFVGTLTLPLQTFAAVIMVTTTEDSLSFDGKCSLREAIRNANEDKLVDNKDCAAGSDDDVIIVPSGTYLFTLAGEEENDAATGDLDIKSNIEIYGNRSGATIIDANEMSIVFDIDAGTVKLYNLIITGGNSTRVGGISNYGFLTLQNSTVIKNNGDVVVGGIYNAKQLTLIDSTVSNNTSLGTGGIGNFDTAELLTLINSTVSNNIGVQEGGIDSIGVTILQNSVVSGNIGGFGAGGISNHDFLTLTNSTVSDNNGFEAGGILNHGSLTLQNSTVSANVSNIVGGIWNYIDGILVLINSTVSSNFGGDYGGIMSSYSISTLIKSSTIAFNTGASVGGLSASEDVTVENTVLANNSSRDCSGIIDTINYSLIGNAGGCVFTNSNGLLTGVDPALVSSLDANGGNTLTHKLKSTSPAIDAGDPAGCTDADGNILETDQRGQSRHADGNGDGTEECDMGSTELYSR